ncbi:MAG: ATPase [Bacteroidetes bacterium]|uniref:ATPase n=1 Tax=Candidatus Gallipaludibacter merdavium TaxID=2840839 RepID=A0A9D9N3K2_9BACT|nr:ATPase [Candidatus Gallipaludibacter merdavium]
MILLADSGSTKTHWRCVKGEGNFTDFFSEGMNPYYQDEQQICEALQKEVMPQLNEGDVPTEIYFYGAGCVPQKIPVMQSALEKVFSGCTIFVGSDLLAAARALCQHQPGIACIIGTGSNSCYYDGSQIERNVSPLGFILGDEGSGAVLGKMLVADLLKNQMPTHLADAFYQRFQVSGAELMEGVYRRSFPNRFLAQFALFYGENRGEAYVEERLRTSFDAFVTRNLLQYPQAQQLPVHFVGSVAYACADVLEQVLADHRLSMGVVMKDPMQGLMTYHISYKSSCC